MKSFLMGSPSIGAAEYIHPSKIKSIDSMFWLSDLAYSWMIFGSHPSMNTVAVGLLADGAIRLLVSRISLVSSSLGLDSHLNSSCIWSQIVARDSKRIVKDSLSRVLLCRLCFRPMASSYGRRLSYWSRASNSEARIGPWDSKSSATKFLGLINIQLILVINYW